MQMEMQINGITYSTQKPEDLTIPIIKIIDLPEICKKIELDERRNDWDLDFIYDYKTLIDTEITLDRLPIGHKVNMFKCALSLHLHYDRQFSYKNVERFY